jgi:hypothetical protein
MRLPLKEISFEELRTRYAELLRFRERVGQLETLRDEKANLVKTADFVREVVACQ